MVCSILWSSYIRLALQVSNFSRQVEYEANILVLMANGGMISQAMLKVFVDMEWYCNSSKENWTIFVATKKSRNKAPK